MSVLITREIGIDMAHRVEAHGSKCRNIHGHRYTIHATITGPIVRAGEEKGMVMDFGFLKEEMMNTIDARCDHATVLSITDVIALHALGPQARFTTEQVKKDGWAGVLETSVFGKLTLITCTPTAENLATVWYHWLAQAVSVRTEGRAAMHSIKVWETPNCYVEYSPR